MTITNFKKLKKLEIFRSSFSAKHVYKVGRNKPYQRQQNAKPKGKLAWKIADHVCVSKPKELEKSRNKSGVMLPIASAAMGSVLFDSFEIGDAITV